MDVTPFGTNGNGSNHSWNKAKGHIIASLIFHILISENPLLRRRALIDLLHGMVYT